MANTKIGEHWKRRVWAIYHNADEPKPGRKKIALQLERDYEPDETGPPGERKVGEFIEEYRKLNDADKREYEYFAWPESMESTLLPWEASRDLLDLLHLYRPILIPLARWYWRACQAMPGASVVERLKVALNLHVPRDEAEALETYLAYAPWQSDAAEQEYEKAIEQRWDPIVSGVPVGGFTMRKLRGEEAQAFVEAMEENDG